jgi:uncharacterized protein YbjT (DUF2867 family)
MKILVLGATGGTGRHIVREARLRGYTVEALVRDNASAADIAGANLIEGDARDQDVLKRALQGCDAVISSLGTGMSLFKEVTMLSIATRTLINAMDTQKIRRLVCITGLGAGDSRGHGGFLVDKLLFPLLLRKVYQDKDRQESLVRGSTLDWVIVRPVMLTDKSAKGSVQALTDLSGVRGGSVSRADVAKFVVEQVTDNTWLRRSPSIM